MLTEGGWELTGGVIVGFGAGNGAFPLMVLRVGGNGGGCFSTPVVLDEL